MVGEEGARLERSDEEVGGGGTTAPTVGLHQYVKVQPTGVGFFAACKTLSVCGILYGGGLPMELITHIIVPRVGGNNYRMGGHKNS